MASRPTGTVSLFMGSIRTGWLLDSAGCRDADAKTTEKRNQICFISYYLSRAGNYDIGQKKFFKPLGELVNVF